MLEVQERDVYKYIYICIINIYIYIYGQYSHIWIYLEPVYNVFSNPNRGHLVPGIFRSTICFYSTDHHVFSRANVVVSFPPFEWPAVWKAIHIPIRRIRRIIRRCPVILTHHQQVWVVGGLPVGDDGWVG